MKLVRNLVALTTATLLAALVPAMTATATTITVHETIGVAQRIVQGMEHFDLADSLTLSGADSTPIAGEQSSAYFFCGTCAAFDDLGEVDVYGSRAQAISEAESYRWDVAGHGTPRSGVCGW